MSRSKIGSGTIARAAMLISSLTAAAFVFTATETVAQAPATVASKGSLASQIGKPIKPLFTLHAKRAKLRTQKEMLEFQAAHPDLGLHQPAHRPLIPMGQAAYEKAKREAAAAPYMAKPGTNSAPPPVAPTTIISQYIGPKESDTGNGFYPPDSNGAVGGNSFVAPVNLSYNVYDRTGALKLHTTFNAFLGTSDALSDPRVIYDPVWKRWIVTIITIPQSSTDIGAFWICISQTSSPTGAFWLYRVNVFANGGLWDYDQLGMAQDAILLTGNHFEWSGTYDGAVAVAIAKSALYNGLGWSEPLFGTLPASGTLTPPIVQDNNANAFFIASDTPNGTIDVYRGTNMSNGFQASYTLQTQLAASGLAVPRNANQRNTSLQLDTLDGRFQGPSAQYGNSLWNVKTGTIGSFPGVYYYQIDTNGNAFLQNGTVFYSATSDDFNPSIAVNTNSEAIITWTATDVPGLKNAMVVFGGRDSTDATSAHLGGTVFGLSNAHLTGNTQGGVERWGDYSSTFLDSYNATNCGGPNRRAGIFNEYIVDDHTWGVKFGAVGFC